MALTSSGDLTVGKNIRAGGNIYGKLVNNSYSNLYRFGGLFFTWDSDSYGASPHHAIRSTYGDTYGDHITLNSFNNIRLNIDSNNDQSSYFEIGKNTTGTGNILLQLGENGNLDISGNLKANGNLESAGHLLITPGGYLDDDTSPGGNSDDWIKFSHFIEMKSGRDDLGMVLRDKDGDGYVAITEKDNAAYFSENAGAGSYFLKADGRDINVGGNITGKFANGAYSSLYRFGGLYFTWDSDSYGTNPQHAIRSTYGDTYGDHITLNSFNNIRLNIDSDNNRDSYFEIGNNTTGTGNTLLRLRDSDGHLGIGTTNPGAKLDVNDDGASIQLGNISGGGLSGNFRGMRTHWNTDMAFFGLRDYGSDRKDVVINNEQASDNIRLQIAGNDKVFVGGNGNVGIGSVTPNAPLSFADITGPKIDLFYHTSGSGDRYGLGLFPSELRIHSGAGGSATGGITFGKQSNTTFTEFVRFTNTGNVGIGTAAPSHKFHVVSSDNAVGLFESAGPQAYLRLATNEGLENRVELANRTGGRLALWVAGGGDALNILKDGNVGIGITNPAGKLHAGGDIVLGPNENNKKFLIDPGVGQAGDYLQITADKTDGSWDRNNGITLRRRGKVGIGTTNPRYTLDVRGQLGVNGASGEYNWLQWWTDNDADHPAQVWDDQRDMRFGTWGSWSAGGTWSEKMRITGSGNVGIGTAAPAHKLHTEGHAYISGGLTLGEQEQIAITQPRAGQLYFDQNYYPDFPELGNDGGGLAVYNEDGWGVVMATNNSPWLSPVFAGATFGERITLEEGADIRDQFVIKTGAADSTTIGIAPAGHAHEGYSYFLTTAPKFWFEKGIELGNGQIGSQGITDFKLNTDDKLRLTVSGTNGDVTVHNNLVVKKTLRLDSALRQNNSLDDLMVIADDGSLATRSVLSIESPWMLMEMDSLLMVCPDSSMIGTRFIDLIDLNGNLRIGDNAHFDDDIDFGGIGDDWMRFSDRIEFSSAGHQHGIVLYDQSTFLHYTNLYHQGGTTYLANNNGALDHYFLKSAGRNVEFGGQVTIPDLSTDHLQSDSSVIVTIDADNNSTADRFLVRTGNVAFTNLFSVAESGDVHIPEGHLTLAEGDLEARHATLSGKLTARKGQFTDSLSSKSFRTGRTVITDSLQGENAVFKDIHGINGHFAGDVSGEQGRFNQDVTAEDGHFRGSVSGEEGTFSISLTTSYMLARHGVFSELTTGTIEAVDIHASDSLTATTVVADEAYFADSLVAANARFSNSLTVKNIRADEATLGTLTAKTIYADEAHLADSLTARLIAADEAAFANTVTTRTLSVSEGADIGGSLTLGGDAVFWGDLSVADHLQIGATALPAGFKLSVDGKIITEEVKIKLSDNWPDYVFDDDYALMPLEKLGRYVRERKHLPDMPSQEEVTAAEGINVGEMNRKLLEKVEQLTLYLLEEHERISTLETELKQLKAENEALKAPSQNK